MGELMIRNVDDEIIERLKARAAAHRQSLEQALCEILIGAVRPSREELVSEADAICQLFSPPSPGMPSAAHLIREDRDNEESYR